MTNRSAAYDESQRRRIRVLKACYDSTVEGRVFLRNCDDRIHQMMTGIESPLDMSKTTKRNFIAIALLALLGSPLSAAAESQEVAAIDTTGEAAVAAVAVEENSPTPLVENFHAGLLEIMKQADALGIEGRIDKLAPLMAKTFDLDFMASKTVGRHWNKLSDDEKMTWAETFARFTVANYAGRFTGFTGEEFVTAGVEDAARGTRVVLTKIVVPGEDEIQLNYRVTLRGGEWKVIDVYLNGTVSELALRRSEYSSALKRDGFAQLLDSIETKINDLKAKDQVEG